MNIRCRIKSIELDEIEDPEEFELYDVKYEDEGEDDEAEADAEPEAQQLQTE